MQACLGPTGLTCHRFKRHRHTPRMEKPLFWGGPAPSATAAPPPQRVLVPASQEAPCTVRVRTLSLGTPAVPTLAQAEAACVPTSCGSPWTVPPCPHSPDTQGRFALSRFPETPQQGSKDTGVPSRRGALASVNPFLSEELYPQGG